MSTTTFTNTAHANAKRKNKSKMPRPTKVQREIKVDKTIMDNFYNLVHSQANIRLTAATSTFKILNVMKKTRTEIFNENLNYCIERLVAGLASNRAQARRGYGTLLLEILNSYQVATERLLSIALTKYGHISKETSGDNLLGYFLLISLILRSGNYKKSKANSQSLEKAFRYLVQLHNTKSYFEYPVSKILVEYSEQFHSFMLADIPQHAFGSDTRLSSIELLTILLCNKKEPVRGLTKLDNTELMEKLSILLDNKFQKRPLHPVFLEATQFIVSHSPSQLANYYSKIIHPTFFKADHNELAAMGLEFTVSALKSLDDLGAIKVLLNEHLVRTLIISLRNQTSLKSHVNKFFVSLKDLFLTEDQDERQYLVLDRLTSTPGSIAFDEDSKSSSIRSLLLNCNSTVLKRYLEKLMSKKNKKEMILASTKQIAFITHRPQMVEEYETMKRIVKFLLLNMDESLDEIIKSFYLNAYHAVLEQLVSTCTSTQRIEHLEDVITFYEQSSGHGNAACSTELWMLYKKLLSKHLKIAKTHNDLKKLHPITTLFLFYGLQIIEHQLDCKEQLEELKQITKEVVGGSEDTAWADIMTDQIIALLSATECKPWIRKLSEKVFRLLVPYVSSTSVDLLCEAIRAPMGDELDEDEDDYESSLEGDDEEDDEEGEEEASEDEENKARKTSNEEKESIRSDEEEGNDISMMEVDGQEEEEQRNSVQEKTTSKKTPRREEEEESEEEYLDDEQMMKLDSVLADMFKLNRKKKSDPSFKLRCLDLVKLFLQKSDNSDSINTILETVIPLYTSCRKNSETRPISDKIMTFLSRMSGKTKYPALVDFLEKQKGGKKKRKGGKAEKKKLKV